MRGTRYWISGASGEGIDGHAEFVSDDLDAWLSHAGVDVCREVHQGHAVRVQTTVTVGGEENLRDHARRAMVRW